MYFDIIHQVGYSIMLMHVVLSVGILVEANSWDMYASMYSEDRYAFRMHISPVYFK